MKYLIDKGWENGLGKLEIMPAGKVHSFGLCLYVDFTKLAIGVSFELPFYLTVRLVFGTFVIGWMSPSYEELNNLFQPIEEETE